MNEITRIHLGRQPFTISVEAHQNLKKYLAAIQKKVHDEEVVREVELRIAELLIERGITAEKVILPEDVVYIQAQLGSPSDFSDEDIEEEPTQEEDKTSKRLFRDTDSAMIAGVSAGIAKYFGLNADLVRIVFLVLAIFSAGAGLVLYLILWVVIPPAVTASEKLQMEGKSVTLESLKDVAQRVDAPGAARRAGSTMLPIINRIFWIIIKSIGALLVVFGVVLLVCTAIVASYMLLHDGSLVQEQVFPVGAREQWLAWLGALLVVVMSVFIMLAGVAVIKRKWPMRAWATGALAGVFLVAMAASIALAVDSAPRIKQRYEALWQTQSVQQIGGFSSIKSVGDVSIDFVESPESAVSIEHLSGQDISKVRVYTKDNTLFIDAKEFDAHRGCSMLCLIPNSNAIVHVYAPNIEAITADSGTEVLYPVPVPSH